MSSNAAPNSTTSKTLVAIAGASGAGKSRLANRLFQELRNGDGGHRVGMIHEDSYYRDQTHLPFEQREKINYDHPDAFEHELLVQHLGEFLNGKPINVPAYDYASHNRSDQTTRLDSVSILIVEGILILHDPRIRGLLDIKVFVDVSLDVCLARRIRRDSLDRGRDIESILDQYENFVRPMYFKFIEPTKTFADIIVPGGGENDTACTLLLDHLRTRLGND